MVNTVAPNSQPTGESKQLILKTGKLKDTFYQTNNFSKHLLTSLCKTRPKLQSPNILFYRTSNTSLIHQDFRNVNCLSLKRR